MKQFSMFDLLVDEENIIVAANDTEEIKELATDNEDVIVEESEHYVGEDVEVEYNGSLYKGKIFSIYNNGDTINCTFELGHTAFYKSKVFSI